MAEEDPGKRGEGSSEKERTKTLVRRVGRISFLGGGFVLFVAMMVGVVQGIQEERAWNPYTGRLQNEGRCLRTARGLMLDVGRRGELTSSWIGRYRKWVTECKDRHEDLYELLEKTRDEYQRIGEDEP